LTLGGRVPGGSDEGGFDEFWEFFASLASSSTIFACAAASSVRSATTSATSSSYVGGVEI